MNIKVPNINSLTYVYVSGIPHSYSVHQLKKLFTKYGKIVDCFVNEDHLKRHGIVTMESESAAQDAVTQMNHIVLNGRMLFMHITDSNQLPTFEEFRFTHQVGMHT